MTAAVDLVIPVGLGELRVVASEAAMLLALGLGSCVGVALWDAQARVGGMAHVVLPAPLSDSDPASAKFATAAVPELLRQVVAAGGQPARLRCAIAGGADVLSSGTLKHTFNIGVRNTSAVLEELTRAGVQPAAQDCGGRSGRSFRLSVLDGRAAVRRLDQDWQELCP